MKLKNCLWVTVAAVVTLGTIWGVPYALWWSNQNFHHSKIWWGGPLVLTAVGIVVWAIVKAAISYEDSAE